jgi:oligoribonuclease
MKKLFWLDFETTGLDENKCVILEVGVNLTDIYFNTLDTFHYVVHQGIISMAGMDEWCTLQHTKSGLLEEVKNSDISLSEVEEKLIDFMDKHGLVKDVILYGNTIGFDRKFIKKYLPKIEKRLHYRMVDVSSFKCAYIDLYDIEYQKKQAHRALEDIQESMNELKYYTEFIDTEKIWVEQVSR